MNFVADEGLDFEIVRMLRDSGHDVYYIAEEEPTLIDEKILSIARKENRILITPDKDFGEIVFRMKMVHTGIILVRLAGIHSKTKSKILKYVIDTWHKDLKKAFVVIQPGAIRIKNIH